MMISKGKQIMCSICPTEFACYKSTHTKDLYYCRSCATYVMMEWGIDRLKALLDTSFKSKDSYIR